MCTTSGTLVWESCSYLRRRSYNYGYHTAYHYPLLGTAICRSFYLSRLRNRFQCTVPRNVFLFSLNIIRYSWYCRYLCLSIIYLFFVQTFLFFVQKIKKRRDKFLKPCGRILHFPPTFFPKQGEILYTTGNNCWHLPQSSRQTHWLRYKKSPCSNPDILCTRWNKEISFVYQVTFTFSTASHYRIPTLRNSRKVYQNIWLTRSIPAASASISS